MASVNLSSTAENSMTLGKIKLSEHIDDARATDQNHSPSGRHHALACACSRHHHRAVLPP